MNSSDAWYNDGYSFSQVCPDEETFKTNAETYFSYLKTHYDGVFGKPRSEKISMDTNENWYIIEQKGDLSDYFDDNPSKLYIDFTLFYNSSCKFRYVMSLRFQ